MTSHQAFQKVLCKFFVTEFLIFHFLSIWKNMDNVCLDFLAHAYKTNQHQKFFLIIQKVNHQQHKLDQFRFEYNDYKILSVLVPLLQENRFFDSILSNN